MGRNIEGNGKFMLFAILNAIIFELSDGKELESKADVNNSGLVDQALLNVSLAQIDFIGAPEKVFNQLTPFTRK